MTQEDIKEANSRVQEVYGESFLATDPLETIIAKAYDLGGNDTRESLEGWEKKA